MNKQQQKKNRMIVKLCGHSPRIMFEFSRKNCIIFNYYKLKQRDGHNYAKDDNKDEDKYEFNLNIILYV